MTKALHVFAQIKKVDEAQRLVYGRAAQEVVDKSDEVMDYASSKPHFASWSADVAKDSGNLSLGNVRAMHGKVAAGKLTAIEFNDAEKAIDVVAKVVDDAEWKKVLEGVYTGFSIGGSYVGTPTVEKMDGKDVKRYTAKPSELSLVDRPCIPSAKFFEVRKADGATEQVEFKESPADPVEVTGTDAEVIAFGKMLNDASLTMADAIELLKGGMPAFLAAKKKKKGEKEGEEDETAEEEAAEGEAKEGEEATEKNTPVSLRKGVYDCGYFTSALQALVCLKKNAAYEAMKEGDNSPIPGKLDACVALVGEVFKAFIDEVMKESKAGTEAETAGMFALAQQAEELRKSFVGEPLAKLASDELLLKIAPAAHVITDSSALEKMVADAIAPLAKQLDDAAKTIKKLEAMPAAPRIALMAVAKGQDLGTEEEVAKVEPVRDRAGKENEVASLIKGLHQSGGAPVFSVSPLRK